MKRDKVASSVLISADAKRLLEELARSLGVDQSAVLEITLRETARGKALPVLRINGDTKYSYRISRDAKAIAAQLAADTGRDLSDVFEALIRAKARKEGVTLPEVQAEAPAGELSSR